MLILGVYVTWWYGNHYSWNVKQESGGWQLLGQIAGYL